MRYTEARLTHLGALLMTDMDKDTVDFVPNYDERLTEPTVFPAAFPNLLVNGGTGIAVGMATNMPPHNLGEVIDGICAQIDKPGITIPELMKFIKGPDFPTGGFICGIEGIKNYFTTGKGSVKLTRPHRRGGTQGQSRAARHHGDSVQRESRRLEEQIANLVNEKVITEISAMRNESDEHCRLVIEFKREAVPEGGHRNLFKHTQLEISFSVNSLAIDHGRPKTLNLKEIIQCYIEHRREVVLRRTRYELRKAEERAELLEGYIIALSNLDEFIHIIRGSSKNRDEAKVKLLAFEWSRAQVEKWGVLIRSEARLQAGRYALTERQVDAILNLRLYQLTGLEIDKIDRNTKRCSKSSRTCSTSSPRNRA
jgi:DNA gyrase subunit A